MFLGELAFIPLSNIEDFALYFNFTRTGCMDALLCPHVTAVGTQRSSSASFEIGVRGSGLRWGLHSPVRRAKEDGCEHSKCASAFADTLSGTHSGAACARPLPTDSSSPLPVFSAALLFSSGGLASNWATIGASV